MDEVGKKFPIMGAVQPREGRGMPALPPVLEMVAGREWRIDGESRMLWIDDHKGILLL